MLNNVVFGNFEALCREASLPFCYLFRYSGPPVDQSSTISQTALQLRNNECSVQTFRVGGEAYRNLGDVSICVVSAILMLVMIYRAFKKYAAVGRKEMNILFSWYLFTVILQLVTTGDFAKASLSSAQIVASLHIGFLVGTFWILMLNGFVGYQFVEDGSALSFFGILISGLAVTAGVTVMALDVASAVRLMGGALSGGQYESMAMFVVYLLLPMLFAVVYTVLQTVLVAKNLGEQKPLVNLYLALLFLIVSQILMFVANLSTCQGTGSSVDGTMFASLANVISIIFVYRFWDNITEDNWSDIENIFV